VLTLNDIEGSHRLAKRLIEKPYRPAHQGRAVQTPRR
jgi:hypothetical protein